jgi:general secretion pathway protein B
VPEPVAPAAAPQAAAPVATAPPNVVYVPAVMIPQPSNGQPAFAPQVQMQSPPVDSAPPLAEEPLLSREQPAVPPDYDANDYVPAVTPAEARIAATSRAGSLPSRDEVLAKGTRLPELKLDLHVYAENPAERFVFINMRKLREGETLPEGVHVDAITPRGAVLSFRGTKFSLDGN